VIAYIATGIGMEITIVIPIEMSRAPAPKGLKIKEFKEKMTPDFSD